MGTSDLRVGGMGRRGGGRWLEDWITAVSPQGPVSLKSRKLFGSVKQFLFFQKRPGPFRPNSKCTWHTQWVWVTCGFLSSFVAWIISILPAKSRYFLSWGVLERPSTSFGHTTVYAYLLSISPSIKVNQRVIVKVFTSEWKTWFSRVHGRMTLNHWRNSSDKNLEKMSRWPLFFTHGTRKHIVTFFTRRLGQGKLMGSFFLYFRVLVTGVLADRRPACLHFFRNFDVPDEHDDAAQSKSPFSAPPKPSGISPNIFKQWTS